MKRVLVTVSVISLFFGLAGCGSTSINEQPMYGGVEKSEELKKADQKFIDWAVNKYGSREKASVAAADIGWQSFDNNDLDTAMKRFNQAWLLDASNAQCYWGFGIIMGNRSARNTEENLRQSLIFLQIAHEKAPANARIMSDLAYSHTILGYFLKKNYRLGSEDEFVKAQTLFTNAAAIAPTEPLIYGQWSILYFYRENYTGAKEKLDKATSLGYKSDNDYINRLDEKLKP